jgi:hypothetical protein
MANQKYEFFLLFGEKLSISEPIEYEIDKAEMKGLLDSLCYQFPKYAITLKSISVNEYINNTLSDNETLSKYAPKIYKAGMKVSKLFSLLFEDTVFDIELSKVLENRKIQGQIIISIDPYDYLTMSVNSHDWRSCHSIEYGDYTTGGFSYMCDETTLIAYRDNGKLYNYNILGFKFVGNSKSWRQCIYVDKESCACIFSRQYPDDIAVVADTIRHSLEACLANYIHNKNAWVKCKSVYNGSYSEESDFNYHDVEEGFEFTFIRFSNLPNPDKYINFKVGSQVFCVYCGKKLKSSGSACCGCKSNT